MYRLIVNNIDKGVISKDLLIVMSFASQLYSEFDIILNGDLVYSQRG